MPREGNEEGPGINSSGNHSLKWSQKYFAYRSWKEETMTDGFSLFSEIHLAELIFDVLGKGGVGSD